MPSSQLTVSARLLTPIFLLASLSVGTSPLGAQQLHWAGFRGTQHDGLATDSAPPTEWSDVENLAWQLALPGPGASSPIVVGDRVFVACFSGYGAHLDDGGDRTELVHHLVCVDRKTGEKLWSHDTAGPLDKDAPRMQLSEHGFASPTPTSDGKLIYSYLGKPGVIAVNMTGKLVWTAKLGDLNPQGPKPTNAVVRNGQTLKLRWGTASSPVLHTGLLFVNASEQSNSIRALDTKTGKLVWKRASANLEGSAITPMIAGKGDDAVLVIAFGGTVWGLAPKTGKLLWEVETGTRGGMSPTPVADDKLVYTFGGLGESFALRYQRTLDPSKANPKTEAGDQKTGEASETPSSPRVAWKSANLGIPSPTLYKGKIFLISVEGVATCINASDGRVLLEKHRLEGRTSKLYSSPVLADGKLYVVSQKRGTFVYKADEKLELLARNQLPDDSKFNGSPAIFGGQLFLRSEKFLYCLAKSK